MIKRKTLSFSASAGTDLIDLTPSVEEFISQNSISEGLVNVFVKGSTAAVTVIEYESNLVDDFKKFMDSLLPPDAYYSHSQTWNDDNGHSHLRASLIGCSETIPVQNASLCLGTWQQLIAVDFDTRPRKREVILTGFCH